MRFFIPLTLALAACTPSQHDEARFGRVTIAFAPSLDGVWDWRADQLEQLRPELTALSAVGPTFVEGTEGSASIVVRAWYSGPSCDNGVARWTPGESFVEVDASCARGYLDLRAAVAHEILHVVGLRHVCFTAGEAADCDPAITPGPAVMNPSISYGDILDAMPGDPLGVATDVPTALDLAEFARTHR